MKPHILLLLSLFLVLLLAIISLFTFTPRGKQSIATSRYNSQSRSSLTLVSVVPPPTPTPQPVLTVQGPPPTIAASAAYVVDADTGHILTDINGEKPLPMASTTKIMTALIAIQTSDLDQLVS